MNEVDDDNNIVGDQPFMGMTFSKKNTLLDTVRSILTAALILVIVSAALFGVYKLYLKYKD